MDSISTSTQRFRFRDHNQEIDNDGSDEGHTSADYSSVSSDEDGEPKFQSMTAKGVQHLCSELLELKQESDEDFQKIIFSNYSAFLAILKERDCLQSEVLGLKNLASSQRRIIKDISDRISSRVLPERTVESVLEETFHDQPSAPSILETHTESVSEILDTFLSERRLDDAMALLEMEAEFVQNLRPGENFSSDQMICYNSTISEKKAMLADQLILVAKHPRVTAPELQKALLGLCQLGDNHLAAQLMLQYYRSRITAALSDLQSSKEFPRILHIKEMAKLTCSMISQAVTSFVALNGETYPYASELTQWASEAIEKLAVCYNNYINSIPEISGRLSSAVDAVQIAMSYCSLLEAQRIFLQPCLTEQIRPCIEEVLQLHIDHLNRVIRIFTSTETWALSRYDSSGILVGRSCAIIEQQPQYFFLTNSGRKFVMLFQSVVEDISPLIALQMENAVLKGITGLFLAYVSVLESNFTNDMDATDERCLIINWFKSPIQGVSVLANLSTLVQFFSSIVKIIFDGIHHIEFEIDNNIMLIQDIYSRLKAHFLDQFISNIFSPDAARNSGSGICISEQGDLHVCDMIPSVPYLELYLELKKLQKLTEDDSIDSTWLISLFGEVIDAAFNWISSKSDIWKINKESLADHQTEFMQFTLDTQFLVEVARYGGYLSDNMMNASKDFVSRVEAIFISAGQDPPRDLDDDKCRANAAIPALHKLQEHEKESLENENSTITGEESHLLCYVGNIPSENDEESAIDAKEMVSRIEVSLVKEEDQHES